MSIAEVSGRPRVYWYGSAAHPNLGDELTRLLLERRYKLPFEHVDSVDDADLVGVGSSLNQVFGCLESVKRKRPMLVVGAGFMHPFLRVPKVPAVSVKSVRGHLSRMLLPPDSNKVPIGDPGLLAEHLGRDVASARGDGTSGKIGFIPHVSRLSDKPLLERARALGDNVEVISFRTSDLDKTIAQMLSCEWIVSQSLNGLVIADSLRLPNAWYYDEPLHAGGEFEFLDYFSSIRRPFDLKVSQGNFDLNAVEAALFTIDPDVLGRAQSDIDEAFWSAIHDERSPWPTSAARALVVDKPVCVDVGDLRREPIRPPELRQEGFEEQFDDKSLFFSVYQDGAGIRLDGPPLWNLREHVLAADWRLDGSLLGEGSLSLVDRGHAQDSVLTQSGESLRISLGQDQWSLDVGKSYVDMFEGRRVIYTKSKNNDLRWIREWARFYASTHGVDGVLLYDNGSDAYSAEEVLSTLAAVPGIDVAVVVSWPFKFGPQAGSSGRFDSDFFEYVVSSNAQHRFLQRAASVTHCDIDELVLTDDGRPLHEHLVEAPHGYLRYLGREISRFLRLPVAEEAMPSFENFGYYDPDKPLATPKWSCIPSKLPPDVQWRTHAIHGISVPTYGRIIHRHFHSVSTGWKYRRNYSASSAPDTFLLDDQIVEAMVNAGIS